MGIFEENLSLFLLYEIYWIRFSSILPCGQLPSPFGHTSLVTLLFDCCWLLLFVVVDRVWIVTEVVVCHWLFGFARGASERLWDVVASTSRNSLKGNRTMSHRPFTVWKSILCCLLIFAASGVRSITEYCFPFPIHLRIKPEKPLRLKLAGMHQTSASPL